MKKLLHALNERGLLSDIDIYFAFFIDSLEDEKENSELLLAAALTSNMTTDQKHICLDLKEFSGKSIHDIFPDNPLPEETGNIKLPSSGEWTKKLKESRSVGIPGELAPLILDSAGRLYLQRYWNYENELAQSIKKRIMENSVSVDIELLKDGLARYFPNSPDAPAPNWQKVAAFAALSRNFCVISGGPGTGKTRTAAAIAGLLLEQSGTEKFRILLAAPTGKASIRLKESVRETKNKLDCPEKIKDMIPEEASTIHRLLGYIPGSPYFQYNKSNPLPAEAVIVDEASMIPLALMSKLLDAVPEKSRVILLGDKDQLASVEAGFTMNDICDAAGDNVFSPEFIETYRRLAGEELPASTENKGKICDFAVSLKHSYRIENRSAIGPAGMAVNCGDSQKLFEIIRDAPPEQLSFQKISDRAELKHKLGKQVDAHFLPYFGMRNISEALNAFNGFKILAALREGYFGISSLNLMIEEIISEKLALYRKGPFYHGQPVMISRNDYRNRLFNGDTGMIWKAPGGKSQLRAYFPSEEGKLRDFSPSHLPQNETAYAVTIHKSQGSEYDSVLIIMPDKISPLLSRELIYTAVTRARKKVEIWGTPDIIDYAVKSRIIRSSGLKDMLLE